MRLIGWILLLSGAWSVWKALADKESLGMGGVLMIVVGVVLLAPAGRALAAWIGGGLLTGLCLLGGAWFLVIGTLTLLTYAQILAVGAALPVQSVVIPLLFLGCGLFLVLVAVIRLVRQYRA
jgi:hypothetical protein